MKDQPQVISLNNLATQMLPRKTITAIDLSFRPVEAGPEEEERDDRIILTIFKSTAIDRWFSILSPIEANYYEKEANRLN